MGCCHTQNKKEQKQIPQLQLPQFKIRTEEIKTKSVSITEQNQEDFGSFSPPKICFISNSNRKEKQKDSYIGGKREIFALQYARPFQKI